MIFLRGQELISPSIFSTITQLRRSSEGGRQSSSSTFLSTYMIRPPLFADSLHLVKPGGLCVVVGPTVWQLHDYPADYWRPLPDFFIEFGRREAPLSRT